MESPQRHRSTRYLLACGLAPVLFTVVILIDGATRPGYEPLHHWGSELSLGDRGWLQITNFIVTGVLIVAFAVGLRRTLRPGRGSIAAPILVGLFGLGLVVAGVFVTDPRPGYPPGSIGVTKATFHGAVHDANAVPCFAALTAAAFVLTCRYATMRQGAMFAYSAAVAVLVPVTFIVTGALAPQPEQAGDVLVTYHGLWQRVTFLIGFVWVGVVALSQLRGYARTHPN